MLRNHNRDRKPFREIYRQTDLAVQIQGAFDSQETDGGKLRAMSKVIERQVNERKYISDHLLARAIDIRENMPSREENVLAEIGKYYGARREPPHRGEEPHLHLEWPE